MKLALLIGPCPRGGCGVGDYTACLSDALTAKGVKASVIISNDWGVVSAFKVRRGLRNSDPGSANGSPITRNPASESYPGRAHFPL